MRPVSLFASLFLLGASSLLQAQEPKQEEQRPQPPPRPANAPRDGGVREVLESIVIPPIPNEPFAATLDTEWVKYAGEGATITMVNERHIARDGRGRIYEERWYLVPKNGKVKSTMNWIQIADPKQHTLYDCSIGRHLCELKNYDPANDLAAAKPLKLVFPNTGGHNPVTVEDLGHSNIAGIETLGRRETTTIEPGEVGNDQPLTATTEYWHSEELGLNLLSVRTSPMFGKQTFTITELTPSEPDAQLFELPAGYKVVDQRSNPPISW
jgi:hypothetical protein